MIELLLFVTGIVTGVMNAIAGGGGLITFPVLMATGMPALTANATNNIAVLPGQIASVYSYRKYLHRIRKRYIFLVIPCTIGALLGAYILRTTETESFEKLVPGLMGFAVVLFAFQPLLHQHLHQFMHTTKKHVNKWQPIFILSMAIMPIAIYGGFFGAGFGFIMLAFLGFTKMHHMHEMNALKNLMGICILISSIIVLFSSGLISWRSGLIVASGNLLGGYFGASLAQKIPSHSIRIIVIVIGTLAAGYLAFKAY
jgi:uncharacterized membrane protein YfcA